MPCVLLLAAGCSSAAPEKVSKRTSGDSLTISDLVAVESTVNVLAFDVSWTTSLPADTRLDVACNGVTPWTISSATLTEQHHVFLMGLVADVDCTLTARASTGGTGAAAETTLHVSKLPAYLPGIDVTVPADPAAIAPGWTLIDLSNGTARLPYMAAAVDAQGRYRWYYRFPTIESGSDTPVIAYQDGVVIGGEGLPMTYVTWQGEIEWQGPSGHHEVQPAETPGDFYYLDNRDCDSLQTGTSAIVEYRPTDDSEIWSWKLCDHYTPPRDVPDWSHLNTVSLFPDKKSLMTSSRNQNSIMKLDRATGQVAWVMGYHGEVEDGFHGDFAVTDADRFFHQHDTHVLPNGHILMFDNGRAGVREWSRALELAYTYDPAGNSKAHAVWEYRRSPDIFAPIWGSARRLENGNTLVCFGQLSIGSHSTIVEASSDSKPVWEIQLPMFWGVYRAERMPAPPQGKVVP